MPSLRMLIAVLAAVASLGQVQYRTTSRSRGMDALFFSKRVCGVANSTRQHTRVGQIIERVTQIHDVNLLAVVQSALEVFRLQPRGTNLFQEPLLAHHAMSTNPMTARTKITPKEFLIHACTTGSSFKTSPKNRPERVSARLQISDPITSKATNV